MKAGLAIIVLGLGLCGYLFFKTRPQVNKSRHSALSALPQKSGTISAGDRHVVALGVDGRMYAWGYNSLGRLPSADACYQPIPKLINNIKSWTSVHTGRQAAYAIDPDGVLWRRSFGEWSNIGCERIPSALDFKALEWGDHWTKVQSSWSRAVALKKDGSLWVWNEDRFKRVLAGEATDPPAVEPLKMQPNSKWSDFCLTYDKVFAVANDGSLWTDKRAIDQKSDRFSSSDYEFLEPFKVKAKLVRLFCSSLLSHSIMALDEAGYLWGFGVNSFGELGDGDGNGFTKNLPVVPASMKRLTDKQWKVVALGEGYTLGIDQAGALWGWGNGTSGVLGNGSHAYTDIPLLADKTHNWVDVATFREYAIGLTSKGEMFAWGQNDGGTLGDGGAARWRTTPTRVYGDIAWAVQSAEAGNSK